MLELGAAIWCYISVRVHFLPRSGYNGYVLFVHNVEAGVLFLPCCLLLALRSLTADVSQQLHE